MTGHSHYRSHCSLSPSNQMVKSRRRLSHRVVVVYMLPSSPNSPSHSHSLSHTHTVQLQSSSRRTCVLSSSLKTKKFISYHEEKDRRKKWKSYRARKYSKYRSSSAATTASSSRKLKLACPPAAPHNTTLMLMDAYHQYEKESLKNYCQELQTENEFNFSGSFLPNLTQEDYQEYFCGSSLIDV